uniref:Uncharacterized protein n=1 Tax=Plectus sambesii TaxID=2011161 RepID=A0A914WAH8_9BILA
MEIAKCSPPFRLFACILFFGILACVIGDKKYSNVVLFKGKKYMLINGHTDEKVVHTVSAREYPLNETGALDAACSVGDNIFFFKGDHFWRTTGKICYSDSISSLFNTTFSSGINAALCSVEIDPLTRLAMQVAYFFKDKSVEKLRRLNTSSAMFQVVQKAHLNFTPDAAVALKITSYSSPSYFPIVASRKNLLLLDMGYPDQMTPFGNLAHNLNLLTDEELYFASDLDAAIGLSGSQRLRSIILALLMIGGIESNPGPFEEDMVIAKPADDASAGKSSGSWSVDDQADNSACEFEQMPTETISMIIALQEQIAENQDGNQFKSTLIEETGFSMDDIVIEAVNKRQRDTG